MALAMAGGTGFLARLNTREKFLLLLMVILFSAMGAFIVVKQFQGSLSDIEDDIHSYDQALNLLIQNSQNVAHRIEQAAWVEQHLQSTPLQMRSFIERQCLDSSVERPSSYSDNTIPQRDAVSGQARIDELETRATINSVEALPLERLLYHLANSGELVVLKVIDLQPARGQAGTYRVDLTLSTFRLNSSS
jgi:hypothetical protein